MNYQKRLFTVFSFAILSLVIFTSPAPASAPANDNFAGATPLILNQQGSAGITTNNVDATKQAGEPNHAENAGGKSVWFSFTPTATNVYRINTVDNNFDTLLAVYTGNAVNGLQVVGHNNNVSASQAFGGASTVDLMLTGGTTYYIAVDSVNNENVVEEGNFKIVVLQYPTPFQDDFSNAHNLGLSYKGSIAGTNYNATLEPNEPSAAFPNPNGKSVWYKWTSSDNFSVAFELTENFDSQIGIYTSNVVQPTFAQLDFVASNFDVSSYTSERYRTRFFAQVNRTYYIKIDFHGSEATVGNFQLKYFPNHLSYAARLRSGDQEEASVCVFRPSEGRWYFLYEIGAMPPVNYQWGTNGDTPVVADFNGDGRSDFAAVRNQNGQKIWYISGANINQIIAWGLPSDKALTGDFDRDGRADLVAIRDEGQNLVWYVRQSSNGALRTFTFGIPIDKPVIGDFDGDGATDVAVIRNTQNGWIWHILKSNTYYYNQYESIQFGIAPDVPAVEDFDGDGKTDIAVFRPSNGTWYILRSSTNQLQVTQFGSNGDKPQPADYDGDGKADLGLFRPSEGNWYFWLSGDSTQRVTHYGLSTDIPVSSMNILSQ